MEVTELQERLEVLETSVRRMRIGFLLAFSISVGWFLYQSAMTSERIVTREVVAQEIRIEDASGHLRAHLGMGYSNISPRLKFLDEDGALRLAVNPRVLTVYGNQRQRSELGSKLLIVRDDQGSPRSVISTGSYALFGENGSRVWQARGSNKP